MPNTFLSLHYHVVFSTKNREPLIHPDWRPRLHDYLGGTLKGLGAISRGVGGTNDHVHVLMDLKATHCLADVIRELKKTSTGWVREACREKAFAWQIGYAGFTVSPSALPSVRRYIAGQEEHHRVKTFREELVECLTEAGIEFELKYLD